MSECNFYQFKSQLQFSFSIPRNRNFLISLKQEATITGLGVEGFETAVQGAMAIYQAFQAKISTLGGHLREWSPSYDGADLALTFGNRYLTRENERGLDQVVDISKHVDPFNVLSPLLRLEVHTTDNVVEYWERRVEDHK